jgi:hypothetical protein
MALSGSLWRKQVIQKRRKPGRRELWAKTNKEPNAQLQSMRGACSRKEGTSIDDTSWFPLRRANRIARIAGSVGIRATTSVPSLAVREGGEEKEGSSP